MVKKSLLVKALAAGALLAGLSYGDMLTTTFIPSPNDLNDLPHASAYSWGNSFTLVAGQEITGARLKIDNLYNWKANESNALWINLLDNPSLGVVGNSDNDGTLNNFFAGNGILLDRMNYNWDGNSNSGKDDGLYSSRTGTNVAIVQDGTIWNGDEYKNVPKYDVTINFTGAELATLTTYIKNKNTFGFGVDADCHFKNSGFKFELDTKTTNVPEPTLISLLGCGLLGLVFVRRRK